MLSGVVFTTAASMTTHIFDPNAAASSDAGLFGLPYQEEESLFYILPVPFDATTSYRRGTAEGPSAIKKASLQVDLFDVHVKNPYSSGIFMPDEDPFIHNANQQAKQDANQIIAAGGIHSQDPHLLACAARVNKISQSVNEWVYKHTQQQLSRQKIVGLVGGDHSTPLGCIRAHAEKYPHMGILHIDAHADLRIAYEGFTYSHASIMYNVLQEIDTVSTIVQVGIRDFCEQEYALIQKHPKLHTFFDAHLFDSLAQGESFQTIAYNIVSHLPSHVYISFDIDGLDPSFCPHTGTPVPGGLSYQQVVFLFLEIIKQKKTIVGFDINEVAPGPGPYGEYDAIVAARLLYKLIALTQKSRDHT